MFGQAAGPSQYMPRKLLLLAAALGTLAAARAMTFVPGCGASLTEAKEALPLPERVCEAKAGVETATHMLPFQQFIAKVFAVVVPNTTIRCCCSCSQARSMGSERVMSAMPAPVTVLFQLKVVSLVMRP